MSTTVEITTRPLRPYQVTARDDVLRTLKTNDRALYVSACGTGKTITLQAIAAAVAGNGLVGAFFPSLFLVGQTLREWLVQYENQWATPIVVCSDPTVTSRKHLEDENGLTPAEIAAMGALVTTSPAELADLIRLRAKQGMSNQAQVIFATYQSSDKVAAAQAILAAEGIDAVFDVAVFDEAHRITPGSALGEHVLDEKKILARKRVSATATPRQFHVAHDGERADDGDLLDESIYGPVAHEYGLRQAIDDGVLTDYRIHATVIPPGDLALAANVDDAEMRLHLGIAALRRAEMQYGAGRAIAYLGSVNRARRFAAMAVEQGLNAHVITGDVAMDEREGILHDAFIANESGVVANVRCLTEGVDVPALDAVVFIDPRKDKVDIVQAVGRAIRRAQGKAFGRVIIPVLAGEGDAETWMAQPGWKTLTTVLAQMADNDTGLRTALITQSKCTVGLPAPDTESIETRINDPEQLFSIDYPVTQDSPNIISNEMSSPPLGDIVQRIIQRTALTAVRAFNVNWVWEEKLEAVIEFVRLNARMPRMQAPQPSERHLGVWLGIQRRDYSNGTMWLPREKLLNESLVEWRASQGSDLAWIKNLDEFVAFIESNGHRPNARKGGIEERRLATWMNRQRTPPRLGRGVTPEQKKMLDERLPGWSISAEQIWQNNLDAAVEYALEHGKTPPQQAKELEARRLGSWLSNQRVGKQMTAQRRAQLDARLPGWDITATKEKFWLTKMELFTAFIEQHGHTPSRAAGDRDERVLENWMRVQRDGRHLTPERRALLDARVPGWDLVGVTEEIWARKLEGVVEFTHREKRMPSPKAASPDEKGLGVWVGTQRRNSSLPPDRRAELDARLPGWGSHRDNDEEWLETLIALKAFVRVNGRIPMQKDEERASRKLRHWLDTQRRTHPLLPERKTLLDEHLPAWNAKSIRDSVWEGRLGQVTEFRALNGRMPLVKDPDPAMQKLARWLATQRHRPDLVTPHRRALLDERLPGWESLQPLENSPVES